MALKKLKFNMIFGGAHHSFGTVLEESVIPLNLRKQKYLLEPNEGDDRLSEMEEIDFDDQDAVFEDELPPTTIPSDSRAKHFKPKPKRR